MDISLPEDKIKYLEGQTQSLQFQLAQRSQTSTSISQKYEEMKESLNSINAQIENERKMSSTLTRDMTRQYKGMQDELLNKINQRDNMIQQLNDELRNIKLEHEKDLEKKDGIIREKDEYIHALEEKMEEQCVVFANMLEDALEKIKERVEVQSTHYDEEAVPIQRRLEELKFNPASTSVIS